MIEASPLKEIMHIKHGFFTREGGKSTGVFGSLNCGYGSGDDPGQVRANRAIAMDQLGLKVDDLNTVLQEHSKNVVIVEDRWALHQRPKADALVTKKVRLAIGVLTADCAPVLFADSVSRVIGVSHAGWRGALGGVLEACVFAMEKIGATRSRIKAVVGPCIQQKSYEVGREFEDLFLSKDCLNAAYFMASGEGNKVYFNLPLYTLSRLKKLAIGNVSALPFDTYEDESRFFSFRRTTHREEKGFGRELSAIVLRS